MKIKVYIVTYNNQEDLENNLSSLFSTDFLGHDVQVSIINNHSNFHLDGYLDKVIIIHNSLRPDWSTGHLSRNWNQALINGFKDLNNPDANLVITCQDDTLFEPNWLETLLELHQNFDFIQMGVGDNFCSYKAEAVKKVGLWDERFCGIGYQEADYFLRCFMYNRDKSSISDFQHGRYLNALNFSICSRPKPNDVFSEDHKKSIKFHSISEHVFNAKYPGIHPNYWDAEFFAHPPHKPSIPSFIYYPYFEKDVYDLSGKGYIL